MEIIFAITIFTIGVVTIGYLVFDAFASTRYGDEYAQARLLAQEGLETLRALQDDDFSHLVSGTYGLTEEGGVWTLSTSSNEIGKFTRSVEITEVEDDIRHIASVVTWMSQGDIERSVRLNSRLTNWRQTGGFQEQLEVRTQYADLTASGTELSGVEVSNIEDEDIAITGMTLTWEGSALLTGIRIDGVEVFSASTSPVSSETFIDSSDFTLNPYSGFRMIDYFRFDTNVGTTNFIVTFFLDDGTHRYVYVTP